MLKVIAIVGPTAVGKTDLSIRLAQQFNGEVISGDSMQVYRGLDIGTAKVTKDERQGIVHHLIDICDVSEQYTAARFATEASNAINEIHSRGHLPIIAGGTGFYLQALAEGLNLGGQQSTDNPEVASKIDKIYLEQGKDGLHEWLQQLDPASGAKIPANNVRRVKRALNVILNTNQLFSVQVDEEPELDIYYIGLTTDRTLLYERINKRVDLMIDAGLENEAHWLYDQGGNSLPAAKGIGYHELFEYFDGETSFEDAVELIKKDSRHYAKRQLTWFRNKVSPNWYNLVEHPDTIENVIHDVDSWLK
ncbi:tRNA (adenosine(37)-N6)-dimethylallyltransferase MiaA [Lentilactobacillus sp. Marseille-Q4993]|uniref:tRNA (adenosine(37)-N6)-dimethylallyltransferase MiaA n=1 Tax=Lentilactobacillus sp. Marseille-Q4993 TaxID=3039492 RepID=UPI0024BCCBAF|nr:tRNA (adenosine(37)-N6)-dimethylallyltransferase MiaA [Lentilactobacillus sp. Marseille-Q4993]